MSNTLVEGGIEPAPPPSPAAPSGTASPSILRRFPSRQDIFYVLGAGAIPIFIWALLSFLNAVPGFALRLNIWELVGMASYVMATALVESIILVVPFVLVSAILPARVFKDRFVPVGSTIIVITCLAMMYANYNTLDLTTVDQNSLWLGVGAYLVVLALAIFAVVRFPRVAHIIQNLVARLAVLAYVYMGLGVLGIIIILIRNL